ncbi:MAG: rRNA adenine N-6-methyltransferase family protein, partial [Patescibacteria group bacterium]
MKIIGKTKEICDKYNIKPARSKGQNFLINEEVYEEIIKAADLEKSDIVLEVGPGLGFLTEKLASRVKKVIAVELDDKLIKILQDRLKKQGIRNVEVINGDILKIS